MEVCFINYGLCLSNSAKYLARYFVDHSQVDISCEARKLVRLFLKLIFNWSGWLVRATVLLQLSANMYSELLTQDWIVKMLHANRAGNDCHDMWSIATSKLNFEKWDCFVLYCLKRSDSQPPAFTETCPFSFIHPTSSRFEHPNLYLFWNICRFAWHGCELTVCRQFQSGWWCRTKVAKLSFMFWRSSDSLIPTELDN